MANTQEPTNTYRDLFQLVKGEIDKSLGFDKLLNRQDLLNRDSVAPAGISDRAGSAEAGLSELLDVINALLKDTITQTIISGLQVTETTPPSSFIEVSAGRGAVAGRIYELDFDTRISVPFDIETPVLYVCLHFNHIVIEANPNSEKLTLAKIVIPDPGNTSRVIDKRNINTIDAYIVNLRKVTLFEDGNGHLEEESLDFFRDNIGPILADNIIGNIRLSEDLKIINAAGTMELNTNSMKFFSAGGSLLSDFTTDGIFFFDAETQEEVAHFSTTDARIGNIVIQRRSIESGNYEPNVSGFQIKDDGDAEFNNIRLRGTLFTSRIAENIFIDSGIRIIGDINLSGSDLWVDVGHKIGYDYDDGQDTYGTYNPATQYFEIWVDGSLRIEM